MKQIIADYIASAYVEQELERAAQKHVDAATAQYRTRTGKIKQKKKCIEALDIAYKSAEMQKCNVAREQNRQLALQLTHKATHLRLGWGNWMAANMWAWLNRNYAVTTYSGICKATTGEEQLIYTMIEGRVFIDCLQGGVFGGPGISLFGEEALIAEIDEAAKAYRRSDDYKAWDFD